MLLLINGGGDDGKVGFRQDAVEARVKSLLDLEVKEYLKRTLAFTDFTRMQDDVLGTKELMFESIEGHRCLAV